MELKVRIEREGDFDTEKDMFALTPNAISDLDRRLTWEYIAQRKSSSLISFYF